MSTLRPWLCLVILESLDCFENNSLNVKLKDWIEASPIFSILTLELQKRGNCRVHPPVVKSAIWVNSISYFEMRHISNSDLLAEWQMCESYQKKGGLDNSAGVSLKRDVDCGISFQDHKQTHPVNLIVLYIYLSLGMDLDVWWHTLSKVTFSSSLLQLPHLAQIP